MDGRHFSCSSSRHVGGGPMAVTMVSLPLADGSGSGIAGLFRAAEASGSTYPPSGLVLLSSGCGAGDCQLVASRDQNLGVRMGFGTVALDLGNLSALGS